MRERDARTCLLLERIHRLELLANLNLHRVSQARALQLGHLSAWRERHMRAKAMQSTPHALDVIVALNSCVRRSAGMTCRLA